MSYRIVHFLKDCAIFLRTKFSHIPALRNSKKIYNFSSNFAKLSGKEQRLWISEHDSYSPTKYQFDIAAFYWIFSEQRLLTEEVLKSLSPYSPTKGADGLTSVVKIHQSLFLVELWLRFCYYITTFLITVVPRLL